MGIMCVSSCRCCVVVCLCVLMFVSDAIGDHMVETYSSMGLVMALYVARIVSFCIFGLMFVGSVMLSICSSSRVLYSAGSGVKRVHAVLSGLRMRLFV